MTGVIEATRAVLPAFELPPLPLPAMVPMQPTFDAAVPAGAQLAPTPFIPEVWISPLPVQPFTAPQPSPDLAWIAQIIADRPFLPWPQPLPPRPGIAAQPIGSAAWLAGVLSDFQFTPWPQAIVGAGRTSPDRVSPIAWAQLFEGGFPFIGLRAPGTPMALFVSPQPIFDAALIADQGQPVISPDRIFRSWPQPLAVFPLPATQPAVRAWWAAALPFDVAFSPWPQPLARAPVTSSDRARAIAALAQGFEGGFPLFRWPQPSAPLASTSPQPLFDASAIVDQGQPPIAIVLRSWPQSAGAPQSTSPDRADPIAWAQTFEGGVAFAPRSPRVPSPPWISPQPAPDAAAVIADQGQPAVVIALRLWPQPGARPLFIPKAPARSLTWVTFQFGTLGRVLLSDDAAFFALLGDDLAARALLSDDLAQVLQILTDAGYIVLLSDDLAFRVDLTDDTGGN